MATLSFQNPVMKKLTNYCNLVILLIIKKITTYPNEKTFVKLLESLPRSF